MFTINPLRLWLRNNLIRLSSIQAGNNCSAEFVNRNPRNLERLRLARKPNGYHLEKPGRSFWHKLELVTNSRGVIARLVHSLNGPVIEASTSEWALRKQLYSPKDTSAFINLGQVFAQRCLESGLTEIYCDIKPAQGGKVEKFLSELQNGGVMLQEPERFKAPHPWDQHRREKPWNVHE